MLLLTSFWRNKPAHKASLRGTAHSVRTFLRMYHMANPPKPTATPLAISRPMRCLFSLSIAAWSRSPMSGRTRHLVKTGVTFEGSVY